MMADASCGPSNAFKGLARHVEQDRSHQQDRVAPGPQQPAQNFRSTPLNSGLNDQFSAFQQQNAAIPQHPGASWGISPIPTNSASYLTRAAAFPPPMSSQQATSVAPGISWVNDFQHMSLSDTLTGRLQTQPTQGPALSQPGMAGHMHPNPMPLQRPVIQPFPSMAVGPYPMNYQPGVFQHNNHMLAPHFMNSTTTTMNPQVQATNEQEFETAMNEWMLQNEAEPEMSNQNELDTASAELTTHEAPEDDLVEDQEQKDEELARAAQQLVDSLADNDSEKFKNSKFLALMRRIASQQLTVQGNDLVENPQPPSPNISSDSQMNDTTSAAHAADIRQPGPSNQGH